MTVESIPKTFVEVLADCPGTPQLLTYHIPPDWSIKAGDILAVPFGSRQVGAIAVRLTSTHPPDLDPAKIRLVQDILHTHCFPPGYWELLERVASYYQTSLLAAIRVALPPKLLQRSQRRIRLRRTDLTEDTIAQVSSPAQQFLTLLQQSREQNLAWTFLQQRVRGADKALRELRQLGWVESVLEALMVAQPKRQQRVTLINPYPEDCTPRQREVLKYLQQQGGESWLQDVVQQGKTTAATLRKLEQAGCLAITLAERLRLEQSPVERDLPLTLTPLQAAALEQIQDLQGYAQVLLHGVTGSGKTEIYLQAIAAVLKQGKSALVLVPEIGLTPQLTDRFRARFGERIRVYHSALSDGERYDTWRLLLNPEPQVVIGTRSAIFAPLPHLGLVILDEEHDSGYKQDQPAPCYHARTVAQWRAEAADCALILGSATPSLETWVQVNANGGSPSQKNHYVSLPQRVQARSLPPISVVDMRQELLDGNRSMFSRPLQEALHQLKDNERQGILFIQRRGYSTFVSCRSCGYVMMCPHCSVSLTYHFTQENPLLRCHYCNYLQPQPQKCPSCESPYFRFFGTGTQRVIEALEDEFPELRLLRFDSDTTRNKGAHRHFLQKFAQGEADLMVGTQMLTKGIDLPQVQLVGVLAADGLLNLPDFRAGERAVQVLLQVAGRAGRGEIPGQVILQTYSPEHPVIHAVQNYQFEQFLETELAQRQSLTYPPYSQFILFRFSGPDSDRVERSVEKVATLLQQTLTEQNISGKLLGPAPANIQRIAGRFRWHLLLQLPGHAIGEPLDWEIPLDSIQRCLGKEIRFTLDIDPCNLL
jgi:primosomal protein N' (replication factor Y) (superfamily II helicase)